MVVARPILVSAPKVRPVTDEGSRGRRRPDQAGQQMMEFAGGERDERLGTGGWRLRGRSSIGLDTEPNQEGRGEQDQGNMYVIRNRPCSPLNPLQPEEVLKTVKGIPRLTAPFARLRSVVGGIACCVRSTAASNL